MISLIFINGAPGVGKTTVCKLLHEKLDSPYIDFGQLRVFHLNREWSNQSEQEEQMAFDNLIYILKNYIKNGFSGVIVTDLREYRTQELSKHFSKSEYLIFTLFVSDDDVLKSRVLNESRDSGYKNFEKAILWNKEIINRNSLENETKIDNTNLNLDEVVKLILQRIV